MVGTTVRLPAPRSPAGKPDTTSNAEAAGKLESPPGADALHLAAATSMEQVLRQHEQRVNQFLGANPGVQALPMNSLEEVHRAQNALQRMKSEFRRKTGITKVELQRIAGNRSGKQIEAIHAEATKLHEEQNRHAA
jgi:hypothetical protein